MIVISDLKEDIEDYYLKNHIIFTEYNNIHNKVIEIFTNYDYYYNHLFSNFNLQDIKCNLYNLSKKILDKLDH
jgi:hypothetical protein